MKKDFKDKDVARRVTHTLPPGAPEPEFVVLDGGDEDNPYMFLETLELAIHFVEKYDDSRLLDALRAKWSDDVERELQNLK